MAAITDLPPEILLHIFRYYLETETKKTLMQNVAQVCLDWQNICLNQCLWTKYDGTLEFEKMMTLCRKGCLSNTKELILSSTDNLKNANEDELFKELKNVEAISFRKVKQLSKNTLTHVANNCVKLKEIEIGKSRKYSSPVRLSYQTSGTFFATRGCDMVKINLTYCKIGNFPLTIRCIADCCPNLENLLLKDMNIQGAFPTKYFQIHCPKLKILHLDQTIRISRNSHSSGFPDLEVFTYIDCEGHTIIDADLQCILFNSSKLKFLNLTNCDISGTVLCSLPACSVEYLYLSRSKICNTNAIAELLLKWYRSLKEVDISHGNSILLNKGVYYLCGGATTVSPLEYLNVSFTKIAKDTIQDVLHFCPSLQVLKLDGCRNLGRGMKRTYKGNNELADLSEKIKTFNNVHTCLIETIDLC